MILYGFRYRQAASPLWNFLGLSSGYSSHLSISPLCGKFAMRRWKLSAHNRRGEGGLFPSPRQTICELSLRWSPASASARKIDFLRDFLSFNAFSIEFLRNRSTFMCMNQIGEKKKHFTISENPELNGVCRAAVSRVPGLNGAFCFRKLLTRPEWLTAGEVKLSWTTREVVDETAALCSM